MSSDYRESHLGQRKAESYHKTFCENPRRSMIWGLEKEILDRIIRRFYSGREIAHLDFACGGGRILSFMENYPEISSTGVDVSADMLEVARRRLRRSRIIEVDITRDDLLGDSRFDLITAFRFFPNAEAQLRRDSMGALVERLAPKGHLVFNNHKNRSNSTMRLARLRNRAKWKDWGMSTTEVEDLLSAFGLEIEETYHIGVLPWIRNRALLPRRLLTFVERMLSRRPILRNFGEDLIYVCKLPESGT